MPPASDTLNPVEGWLALPAFAKINLSLELLGRRPDGYWEIRTVYQTLTLHDRLRLRLTRRPREVVVRVPGGGAPPGPANLVHRLLRRARRALNIRHGVEVELEKNIPAGRGLGGGSSDAAAALVGLLRLTHTRLSLEELSRLGAPVGADLPFFFVGGRALGVGRGEQVYPLDDAQPAHCLLVCPPYPIATRAAYGWAGARTGKPPAWRLTPSRRAAIIAHSRFPPDELWGTRNDFEPVVFSRFPELARMKAGLFGAGARQAGLSGSGSTIYAFFSHRPAAQRAAARWARAATLFAVDTLPRPPYQRLVGVGEIVREET